MARERYAVAVYELDRHYGGPEEGGWWYTSGRLERIVRVGLTEAAAYRITSRANHLLEFFNKRARNFRRDLYSMGYAGGSFGARPYTEREIAPFWPEELPHYE